MLKDEIERVLEKVYKQAVDFNTKFPLEEESIEINFEHINQALTRILELMEKEKNKINYCICPYTITNADICGVCGGKVPKSNGG